MYVFENERKTCVRQKLNYRQHELSTNGQFFWEIIDLNGL